MISRLCLNNFKCFSDVSFELSNINVLAGSNACGKSSVIHALLIARQSWEKSEKIKKIFLSGKYINLGQINDIINEFADKGEELSIDIINETGQIVGIKPIEDNESYVLDNSFSNDEIALNLFSDGFEYLSAERIVPSSSYSMITDNNSLGIHGEYTMHFLADKGLELIVEDALCANDSTQKYLLYQTNAWLKEIFDGIELRTKSFDELDSVSLRYQETNNRYGSMLHRSINVGFGITYTLPIIVALLKSRKDDLLIIENPEAHLHPKAQTMVGYLITKAAANGTQIILETHSDHVLNGIRVSVKEGLLSPEQTKIFFFARENVGSHYKVNVFAPNINIRGGLDYWPEGFLDEWDKALTKLF